MNTKVINGKPLHKVGIFQVWQTDTDNYIVTGGEYDLLFEQMPTVDELTFKRLLKPVSALTSFQRIQLEKRGNVLINKSRLSDNTNLFDRLLQNHIELSELSAQGY